MGKKIKEHWAPIVISVASLLVLIAAWWLTDQNGELVSRAGALITACGLLFAFWPYDESLEDIESLKAARLREEIQMLGFSLDDETVKDGLSELKKSRRKGARIVARWEALLLMFGTLIWGFGDLAYKYSIQHF